MNLGIFVVDALNPFPVACNVLMTATSAIIIHIFKLNCGSHVIIIIFDIMEDTAGIGGRIHLFD